MEELLFAVMAVTLLCVVAVLYKLNRVETISTPAETSTV